MKAALLALAFASCAPLPPVYRGAMACHYTCIADGLALTAGHCEGLPTPVAPLDVPACKAPRTRLPVDGEPVTIGARQSSVISARWFARTILDGRAQPGESGSGVYGADGALLAIVLEAHDNYTYAHRLEP